MPIPNKKLETSRMLRVVYTDAERLELGKKLADEHADLRAVNSDFDRVKAEFKSKITTHEANIEDLSNKVSTGYRIEDVKARWALDDPKSGTKTLRRLDTKDVIEVAEMTTSDRQVDMDLPSADQVMETFVDRAAAGEGIEGFQKLAKDSDVTTTIRARGKEVTIDKDGVRKNE